MDALRTIQAAALALSLLLGPEAAISIAESDSDIKRLLEQEPPSIETWPAWRDRLEDWLGRKDHAADAAFDAVRKWLELQAKTNNHSVPVELNDDYLAWYLLGSAYLYANADSDEILSHSERSIRRSIKLNDSFARAHRNLAVLLTMRGKLRKDAGNLEEPPVEFDEATQSLERARILDPTLELNYTRGQIAMLQGNPYQAEQFFRWAMDDDRSDPSAAVMYAVSVVSQPQRNRQRPYADSVRLAAERFPDDGKIHAFYGLALAIDGRHRAALGELNEARRLGDDPTEILGRETVQQIEEAGSPSAVEHFLWLFLGIFGFYGVVIASMAAIGVVLAYLTRGTRAAELLGRPQATLVERGWVARTMTETWLAKLYAAGLMVGLLLFYPMVPLIAVGVLGGTAAILYFILLLGHIPVKLVLIVAVVGLMMAWAVIKSLFARGNPTTFGIQKYPEDLPQLDACLKEVARNVETAAVDEIRVTPNSAIGVQQSGRGPFGLFGVKQRVLTLGISSMRLLTVNEFKSVLAHEYAHFSHSDTFYNRFIYQVTLSMEHAISGMGAAAGKLNYVNPFFWFMMLYYWSYTLLSAGYSRSREFLADRMAATLYGRDVFESALRKITMNGELFEAAIFQQVATELVEENLSANMYLQFESANREQFEDAGTKTRYEKLLSEKESLFASHPTFVQRVEALGSWPDSMRDTSGEAISLIGDRQAIEEEYTQYFTGFMRLFVHAEPATEITV